MKRKLATVVSALLVAAAVPLFAAGGKETKATLSVLWFNDGNESDVFMKAMEDYQAKNPNIALDMQVVPFKDYESKLKLMVAAGNPPDVVRMTNAHVAAFADQLEPLQGKTFADLAKNFYESSLALGSDSKGTLVAMPTEATANGMIVNKTYFKAAGIDIDQLSKTWTWDQWVQAMKKVLAANPKAKYGLALDYTTHRWSTLMYAAGGRFLNNDGTAMNFTTAEVQDTLSAFKMLHEEKLVPSSVWMGSENPQELFVSGLAACHIGGSWLINAYNASVKDFEWGAVRMPKRKINSSVPGGKFIATFKQSANKAAALDVIAVFSDLTHNERYCKDTFNLSARKDVNIAYPARTADFAVFGADLAATPAYVATDWKSPAVNKVNSYVREQIVEYLIGKQTIEQTVKNVQERGNSFFK